MQTLNTNQVVWFELGTQKLKKTMDFYQKLFGWHYEKDKDSSVNGNEYFRIIASGSKWPMGALFSSNKEESNVSILVEDAEKTVKSVMANGGKVIVPVQHVSDVTAFARLADPKGNMFSIFTRTKSQKYQERVVEGENLIQENLSSSKDGTMSCFMLGSDDVLATKAFYSNVFNWHFIDISSDYCSIRYDDDIEHGGLLQSTENYLSFVIHTDSFELSEEKVSQFGGTVLNKINQPNLKTLHVKDPDGRVFDIDNC